MIDADTPEEGDRLRMTPGPTALPPSVRDALAREPVNPDVEAQFARDYRRLLDKLAVVYRTDDDVVVLSGEGMLGLEASVRSLVGPDDTVLCLANGIYGEGFADLVEMGGATAVVHDVPPGEPFDVEAVRRLARERDPVAATMVHCETPAGLLNDLDPVLDALEEEGVLTVVDAVSSLGGAPVPVERIDVCLGASQKCFSSPPGLATLSVSDRAWAQIESVPQDSFYANLEPWRDFDIDDDPGEPVLLPYTPSVSNLQALEASLDRLLDEGLDAAFERHARVAERCRERGRELGLDLQPPSADRCSPTVTAFRVEGRARSIQRRLDEEHGVVVATSIGDLADDVLRVGHMGYNADLDRLERTMDALAAVLD